MSNTDKYIKKPEIEDFFSRLNNELKRFNDTLLSEETDSSLPVLFIVGVQRSGTTLLMQLMAKYFIINYPDNLIARFWNSPTTGAMLKQQLQYSNESQLKSDLGFTSEIYEPHEFGYFWRRWFDDFKIENWTDQESRELIKELVTWHKINNLPIIFKNLIQVVPNIQHLAKKLPSAKFIVIKRSDEMVIQSTLQSRKNLFGNESEWFGIKPARYSAIIQQKDPLLQVTEQVFYLNKEISNFQKNIEQDRVISINYEDLIDAPEKHLHNIKEKFKLSYSVKNLPRIELENQNRKTLTQIQFDKVYNHLNQLNERS